MISTGAFRPSEDDYLRAERERLNDQISTLEDELENVRNLRTEEVRDLRAQISTLEEQLGAAISEGQALRAKVANLQQQANEKMLGVIEENNISIEEYNAINEAVQTDPELRNRVIAMMQ